MAESPVACHADLPSVQLQEASASKPISIYEQLKQKDWAQSFYWAQSPSSKVAHCLNRLMRLAHFPSSTLSRGWSPTQSQRVERQTIKPLVERRGKRWCEKEYVEIYARLLEAYDKPVVVVAVASFASTMCNAAIAFLRTRGKQPLEWRLFGLSTQFLVPDLASSSNEGRSSPKIPAGCQSKANSLCQSYAVMHVVKWLASSASQRVSLTKLKYEP